MLESLRTRSQTRRKAGELYGAVVAQARRPEFYTALGVPDTPVGRYEMVVLHLFLVLEQLRSAAGGAAPLDRLLVEAFIEDMDDSLRELATGDLSVAKKVRRAAAGLYDRSMDYRAALADAAEAPLAAALARYIHDAPGEAEGAEADARLLALAAYVRQAVRALSEASPASAGVRFPDPPSSVEVQR